MARRLHLHRNLLIQAAITTLLFPAAAQAHGEQIFAFPLSGFIAFLAMIPIVLLMRARRVLKVLTVIVGLPMLVLLTWLLVIWLLDPTASGLAEEFSAYTALMAVPPVVGCVFLLRVLRRRFSDKRS